MDLIDIARYVGAMMLVLALLGFAGLAARRYGLPGIVQGSTVRRLAVVETLMVGPRHKLYILRRDGTEHLVMIGPQGTTVIERAIAGMPQVVTEQTP
ncbi:MAG TPA: flagellar biosynthetic protein FliO [Rhizomicrobium sp.]|jgi:flagellar protein FliO/FliZ